MPLQTQSSVNTYPDTEHRLRHRPRQTRSDEHTTPLPTTRTVGRRGAKSRSEALINLSTQSDPAGVLPTLGAHATNSCRRISEPRKRSTNTIDTDRSSASNRSSIIDRLVLSLPRRKTGPLTVHHDKVRDNPKSDRQGKRECSRHWLELRLGRKQCSNKKSLNGCLEALTKPSSQLEAPKVPYVLNYTEPAKTCTPPPLGQLIPDTEIKEGLYCRVKRRLGLKHGHPPHDKSQFEQEVIPANSTAALLWNVARVLRELEETAARAPGSSDSASNFSIATTRYSSLTRQSFSSSLRQLRMGKGPKSSPDPAEMYTGSDNQTYLKVDPSHPCDPSFLLSEARRISSPFLPSSYSRGKLRSYFANLSLTGNYNPGASSFPDLLARQSSGRLQDGANPERELFRAIIQEIENEYDFRFNIPDHLPNSPLCPLNSTHKLKGKGVCVYHGRASTADSAALS